MVPNARTNDLVLQKSGDELLVYDLITNKAICLNHASALVWQLCDGQKSPYEIGKALEKELKTKIDEELVWFALEKLYKENLLDNEEDFTKRYKGLSRREAIKRVGFSSMVALSIISSIVSPSAISAQSGACMIVINGCSCPNNTPTGTDCTGFESTPCADPVCRCVDNGIGGPGGGDCVP